MTPQEQDLVFSLVTVPGRPDRDSRDAVLRHFGTDDGRALGLTLLRDSVERRDPVDLEAALVVCDTFGFGTEHLGLLAQLSAANWHHKHEDVVTMLGQLHDPGTVRSLYHAAEWVPDYLDFDDNRALAKKAIWGLGGTPGPQAHEALEHLLNSDSDTVRQEAATQLARRERS